MATREPELYKDKVEVSLDGRQIFYLFFGGAVLVGLVFVLGVMVGRRVESRSHVDRLDHARAASDPLAALDGLESKRLTFQDTLTKTEPKTPVEHTIDDVANARGAIDDKKPEVKAAERSDVLKGSTDVLKGSADVPKESTADKKAADKKADKADDKKLDDKKPEKADKKKEKKSEPKPAEEPVTKPDQAAAKAAEPKKKPVIEELRVNADVVTAVDPKKPEKADKAADKPADKATEKETKAKFTLQLSSFQDKHEAETFLSSVKAAGYQAYVTEAEVSGKGTFYRVRLGNYRSLEAANDAKADVEKALRKSASVMRL